jgi:hypothetical protein
MRQPPACPPGLRDSRFPAPFASSEGEKRSRNSGRYLDFARYERGSTISATADQNAALTEKTTWPPAIEPPSLVEEKFGRRYVSSTFAISVST